MRSSSVPASGPPRIGIAGRGAGPRAVAACTLPLLISASSGPADAGTIRAMTSPRSVTVISSPRLTRASTFDVSWLSARIDTSPTQEAYYIFVLHDGGSGARNSVERSVQHGWSVNRWGQYG